MFKIPCFICATLCLMLVSGDLKVSHQLPALNTTLSSQSSASAAVPVNIASSHVLLALPGDLPEVATEWGPYLQQVSEPFQHGGGLIWNHEKKLLYFVDQYKGLINSFNPHTNSINNVKLDGTVTPVIPTNTVNKFAVGLKNSVVLLEWDGRNGTSAKTKTIVTVDQDKRNNIFNDGKADMNGRLWWGTMGYQSVGSAVPDAGSLYKYDNDNPGEATVEIPEVTISNGLAWSKDNTKFYYIDTPTRKIAVYDFNLNTGTISRKRIAFDLANHNIIGDPAGMTIDEDDNLFIALIGGGAVIQVDPRAGKLLQKIAIPAKQVTSVTFGGDKLDILFVTTSRLDLNDDELGTQPAAGCLFALTGLRTRGRNANFADI